MILRKKKVFNQSERSSHMLKSGSMPLNPLAMFPTRKDKFATAYIDARKYSEPTYTTRKWLETDKIYPDFGVEVKVLGLIVYNRG